MSGSRDREAAARLRPRRHLAQLSGKTTDGVPELITSRYHTTDDL